MLEYKERIKNQVIEWFDNIKKQPLELNKNTNGLLVTPNPEDMFNIIHAQLEVAREKLPLEYTKEVAIACLQVIQDIIVVFLCGYCLPFFSFGHFLVVVL